MAYWEASRPPRHSTHHHSRHNQPHDENSSYKVLDHRSRLKHPRKQPSGDSTIAKPNSTSQQQTRYDLVQNWLEQTARQSPHSWPSTSQRHKKVAENSYPSRPLDATSPYNKHPRRVDPRWSSRHGFPSDKRRQSASPFQDLDLEDQRKFRRGRATPSDSSFISGFGNSTKPPDYKTGSIRWGRKKIPPVTAPGEAPIAPIDASSTTSHVSKEANFEKRPRRKTREDKYETKKTKRKHEQEAPPSHDDHRRKKHKRAEKRKSTISSKNVVNNFSSDAVLNNRITPHLKPGLFDNGRKSKKQPISDLAFSEMHFLKHQKRNTQPKLLSKSRLRDKQREGREMEEVSSFFLPYATNGNAPNSRRRPRTRNDHQSLGLQGGQLPYNHAQEFSTPLPPDHCLNSVRVRVSPSCEETIEAPSLDPVRSINDGKESAKNTAYFTWSSSRHSLQPSRRENNSSPNVSDSVWTTTPDPIRRDLIATGIYRNTGIPLYDDQLNEPSMGRRTIETKASSIRLAESRDSLRSAQHELNGSQKVKYRDQAIMTDDPPKCLGPPSDTQITEERQPSSSQEKLNIQPPQCPREINRQQIARDVRLTPIERGNSRQNTQPSNVFSTEAIATHPPPMLLDTSANRNLERQTRETTDQASMTSRDAMPPPPIPSGRHSSFEVARANIGEVDPPQQNVSAINRAAEVSEASHAVSYSKDVQDIRAQPNSCDPTTSSSESIVNNERTLLSFNTASWIPQRTPSARIKEMKSIPPLPSMKSPIYIDQCEGKSNAGSYRRNSTESQAPESMAEFIARIESESLLRSPPRDRDILDPQSEIQQVALDDASFDTNQLQEQFPTSTWQKKTRPHLAPNSRLPYPNPESSRMDQQHEGEFYVETQYPEYGINTPSLPEVMHTLEDFEEERFEMSNFWRPNQFSRF
ncbi:hypothetical protein F4776DRAFT_285015 [Hypoxylon sp. NC0597]|nr:hypothetical protein F4776DRAFT_285015 [Hypoxylon sp. NC0597]